MQNQREWARAARDRKFFLLFLSLLLFLILYPYLQYKGAEFFGIRIFGCAVTLLSVYVVSFRRVYGWLAFGLAVPALLQRGVLPFGNTGAFSLLVTSFAFLFDLFVVVVVFRLVFTTDRPNSETIFGALCIYLLLGFSFAHGYFLLVTLQPQAFSFAPGLNFATIHRPSSFIYYSFGTLTCLGTPGITPASDEARSLSVIQAILGILYLAVLISRLLDMYKRPVS